MTIAPLTPGRVVGNFDVFAPVCLKIYDKKHNLVPLRFKEAQRILAAQLTDYNLCLKGRQLGASTYIQAWFYYLAVTQSISTLTLGHDQTSTDKMRRIAKTFQDNMPRGLAPTRAKDSADLAIYLETGSEATIATAGNTTSGRSMTFQYIHASEAAYYPDAKKIIDGALQAGDPIFIAECTANGAQGWFYEDCMEALDGNKDKNLIFLAWWLGEEYQIELTHPEELGVIEEDEERLIKNHSLTLEQIKWRRFKKRQLKDRFPQEYPENPNEAFLLSGVGVFGPLEKVFAAALDATPQEGHLYYAGVDWGQQSDYTVLSIGDADTCEQVLLKRWRRIPFHVMRQEIADICKAWRVRIILAEKNAASSNVEDLADLVEGVQAFNMTAKSKPRLVNGLIKSLEGEDGWKLLADPDQMREMRAYQSSQNSNGSWSYSAPSGEHDDTVIATMLMLHAASRAEFARV